MKKRVIFGIVLLGVIVVAVVLRFFSKDAPTFAFEEYPLGI